MELGGQAFEKSLLHFEKKEYKKAEKYIDELLEADPQFQRGWFLKGVILEETGRASEAEKYFEKAGNLYNMWFRLALQLGESDPQKAIGYFDRVLQMNPYDYLALFNKGLLCEKAGMTDEAKKCFQSIAAGKEVFSRIIVPLGFMIFLSVGGVLMFQKGDRTLSLLVLGMAGFCVIWLKRDLRTTLTLFSKKRQYGK